jgi:asparagine synthase (glutamine-hydrolysing)
VARHLGTDHHEWIVTPADALNIIPELASIYDEPFADPAAIPTCLLSRMARQNVTVTLSGDGADECFGGYDYHIYAERGRLATVLGLPEPVRRAVARGTAGAASLLRQIPSGLTRRLGTSLAFRSRYYQFRDPVEWYRRYVADHIATGERIAADLRQPAYPLTALIPPLRSTAEAFMLLDGKSLLPDGHLTKLDRATMAASLEGRVPFLDTDLVRLAWQMPTRFKIHDGNGKWVLRQILAKYLPPAITERPKQGFGVPLDTWLRGPLRDWVQTLLEPAMLKDHGLLNAALVRQMWNDHVNGKINYSYTLWKIITFQSWFVRHLA